MAETKPKADEIDITTCSLEQLARETARICVAIERAQERQAKTAGKPYYRAVNQEKELDRRLKLIEAVASHLQAETATGALFQVMLIHLNVHFIADGPPRSSTGRHPEDDEARKRAIGYLYSVRRYLESLTEDALPPRLSEYYMLAANDPHALVDQAMAEIPR